MDSALILQAPNAQSLVLMSGQSLKDFSNEFDLEPGQSQSVMVRPDPIMGHALRATRYRGLGQVVSPVMCL